MVRRKTWSDVEVSAYLDGELDAVTREAFEAALAQDQALRRRVDDLRDVVGLMQAAPLREPPRNYLLTPGMVAEKTPPPANRRRTPLLLLRLATSAVAAAFVVTAGLGMINRGIGPAMMTQRDAANIFEAVTPGESEPAAEEPEMAVLAEPLEEKAEKPPSPEDKAAFEATPDQGTEVSAMGSGSGDDGDAVAEKTVVGEAPAAAEKIGEAAKEAPGDGIPGGGPQPEISLATDETVEVTPTPAPTPEPIIEKVVEERGTDAPIPRVAPHPTFPPLWLPVTLGVVALILTVVTIWMSRKR